ncbi:MAG: hypothetical protein MUF14_08770 [Hyphomonadaceae bacterium]|jgi:hypothetical protein|nr:hypothetical protein [Hyphomonadaceae bacterium]
MGLMSDILPAEDWQPRMRPGPAQGASTLQAIEDNEFYRLSHAGGAMTFAVISTAVLSGSLSRLSGVPLPDWIGTVLCVGGVMVYLLIIRADRNRRKDVGLSWFWDLGRLSWGLVAAMAISFLCILCILIGLSLTGALDQWIALEQAGHPLAVEGIGLVFGLALMLRAARHWRNWRRHCSAIGARP